MSGLEQYLDSVVWGDCVEVLPQLPDDSIDAVITDPPAGFVSEEDEWGIDDDLRWDYTGKTFDTLNIPRYSYYDKKVTISKLTKIFTECYRVLKPGGHIIAWAVPRTSHWTAMAIEDAGFEIRDIIHHIYSGSLPRYFKVDNATRRKYSEEFINRWSGWVTGIKPMCNHWIMGRKQIKGGIMDNLREWDVGMLNARACQVYKEGEEARATSNVVTTGEETQIIHEYLQYFNLDIWAKNHGLLFVPKPTAEDKNKGIVNSRYKNLRQKPEDTEEVTHNYHPTIKSITLMSWLIVLVTRENHIILDPFAGSGSTGVAAKQLGRRYILIEKRKEYVDIANKRLSGVNVLNFSYD